jgi:BlaI family penicillinase repressor
VTKYKYKDNINKFIMVKNIGPLERKILDILWERKEASARQITSILEQKGERRAYSTIRTIINRLVEKRILGQRMDKKERMYLYTPLISKENLEKSIVHSVIGELLKKFEKSTISYLAEELSDNEKDIEKIRHKLDEMKNNE